MSHAAGHLSTPVSSRPLNTGCTLLIALLVMVCEWYDSMSEGRIELMHAYGGRGREPRPRRRSNFLQREVDDDAGKKAEQTRAPRRRPR